MHAQAGSGESRARHLRRGPADARECSHLRASGFAIADTALLLGRTRRQKRQNPLVAPLPALRHISFRVGEGRRASLAPVAERGPAVRQVEACKAAEAAANVQQRLVHQVDAGAQVQIPQTRPPLGRHWLEELQLQVKGVSYHIFVSQVAPRPSGGCTSARALRHVAYFSTPAVSAPSEAKILEVLLGF